MFERYVSEWLNGDDFKRYVAALLVKKYQRASMVGLLDRQFVRDFCSGEAARRSQRLWELNLACHLLDQGLDVSSKDDGPDFMFMYGGRKYWIEAISPEPKGIPNYYLDVPKSGDVKVVEYPEAQILERVTGAIHTKFLKFNRYLQNKIVGQSDGLLVAVDISQLMAFESGISGMPLVVEAVYPVGPMYVRFGTESGEVVDSGRSYRSEILKEKGRPIETTVFLQKESAILSGVLSGRSAPDRLNCVTMTHNYLASIPFPQRILGAAVEIVPRRDGDEIHLEDIANKECY